MSIRIELERLTALHEEPIACALCERPFRLEVVVARLADGRVDAGEVCPECAGWLARGPMAQTGHFPSVEEVQRLEAEWRTPIYASWEEADLAFGL